MTGGFKGFQGVTRDCLGIQGLQGVSKGLQGVSKGLQGVTRGYRGLQGGYRCLQGVTRGNRGLRDKKGLEWVTTRN